MASTAVPHQALQVCAGHDLGGVQCNMELQGLQGQGDPRVHQEKGGDVHASQEEAEGVEDVWAIMRKALVKED